jgi:hypothetical protein
MQITPTLIPLNQIKDISHLMILVAEVNHVMVAGLILAYHNLPRDIKYLALQSTIF